MSSDNDYASSYSSESFWDKILGYAKSIGREITHKALCMFYALQDQDTPIWARTVIIGALGYFIFPVDAIPDIIPGVGFADDAGAIAAAFAAVLVYVKQEHRDKATEKCNEWFGPEAT